MTQAVTLIEDELLHGPWVMGDIYTICDPYLFTISRWLEDDGVDDGDDGDDGGDDRMMAPVAMIVMMVAIATRATLMPISFPTRYGRLIVGYYVSTSFGMVSLAACLGMRAAHRFPARAAAFPPPTAGGSISSSLLDGNRSTQQCCHAGYSTCRVARMHLSPSKKHFWPPGKCCGLHGSTVALSDFHQVRAFRGLGSRKMSKNRCFL